MADVFKVLSIDGGGIRGIIPAMVLAEIEDRTGRPVAETFDLIAGTSTGGILALGLTLPGDNGRPRYAAEELIGLYEEEGYGFASPSSSGVREPRTMLTVSDALDDVRPQNLRDLKLLARTLIDGEDERLSELYERLK